MKTCTNCVLTENYPGIVLDENSVCNHCASPAENAHKESNDVFTEEQVRGYLSQYKNLKGKYDVLVPVSGGVDGSLVLMDLVEKYHLKPLAYHNDQGYEDEIAVENARKLCKKYNVDLVIWQHDYEFMKKLFRYANQINIEGLSGCYICGTLIFANSLELADKFDIPLVINGYSKGQIQFTKEEKVLKVVSELAQAIAEAGDLEFAESLVDKYKVSERQRVLSTKEALENSEPDPNIITFIPYNMFGFYKFDKEVSKRICNEKFGWQPMKYTYPAGATNCELIWLNTYFDLKKMNYSVYTEEYSELVRKGELTREQALEALKFNPPEGLIERLCDEIGIDMNIDFSNKTSLCS